MNLNTLINLLEDVRDQVGGQAEVLMFCDNNTSNPFDDDCEWNQPSEVVALKDEDSDDSVKVFIKYDAY